MLPNTSRPCLGGGFGAAVSCRGVYVRKVMSWDDGFLGARASRPHKACHSPGHLPHLDQPGMAPWLSFGLADAVPADRVAACSIALKLSRGQRDRMRAGRPRSQAMPWGVPGGRLLRKPTCTPGFTLSAVFLRHPKARVMLGCPLSWSCLPPSSVLGRLSRLDVTQDSGLTNR